MCSPDTYYFPFKKEHLKYTTSRLGFVPQDNVEDLVHESATKVITDINGSHQIMKLLIAEDGESTAKYHFKSLASVIDFLHQRVRKYPKEKYADRMFFGSILFQSIIDFSAKNRDIGK